MLTDKLGSQECLLQAKLSEFSTVCFERNVEMPELQETLPLLATFPMGWRLGHADCLFTTDTLYSYARMGIDVNYLSTDWLEEHFKYTALLRYFEIWGKLKQTDLVRGLCATKKLAMRLAGMVGALNSYHYIYKDNQGYWHLAQPEAVYPEITRLPEKGILTAKKLAKA